MTTLSEPWMEAGWLEEVTRWINQQLHKQNLSITGEMDQFHIRHWSTVMRVPTTKGSVYFKAVNPTFGHEVALTAVLYRWRPDVIITVLAADPKRGWMILEDGGGPMRSLIHGLEDFHHWETIMSIYPDVQRDTISRVDELLALGVTDRRLSQLPALYEQVLDDTDMLFLDQLGEDGLTTAQYQQLRDLIPEVRQRCTALASYGIPETLHNDDFHDNNIFVKDGVYRLADWDETQITHPFFSLMIPFRGICFRQELKDDDPVLGKLRDIYLKGWGDYGDHATLVKASQEAHILANLNRSLSWYNLVTNCLTEASRPEFADAVPGWLSVFLSHIKS